jgi:hypothetical protein
MTLSGPLKQLAIAAAKAAVEKVVDLYKKKVAKDKAQKQWTDTPNQPWGCERCKNWNYLGGAMCGKCRKAKP